MLEVAGDDATEIDAGGNLVLPGFQDTHVHVPEAGINEGLCFLEPNQTLEAYEKALAGCVDGILDLGTAHLLAPYDEPPDPEYPSRFEYFDQDTLDAYAIALDDLGFQLHFHVIGEAATRSALDAVDAVEAVDPDTAEHRHRTTHTYLVDPADVPRFAELGVIADFQMPTESINADYADYMSEFIGDRAYDLIPTRALLDTGANVSLSSDWDADELSPVGTIDRALTRPTEAVADLETAIRLVTVDAAYALGQDDRTGTIEVAKQADFVILDQNLFDIEPDQISDTKVLLTAVGGRTVYEDPDRDRQRRRAGSVCAHDTRTRYLRARRRRGGGPPRRRQGQRHLP